MKKSILFLALLLKIPGVFASDHLTMEQQDEEMRHVLNKIPPPVFVDFQTFTTITCYHP